MKLNTLGITLIAATIGGLAAVVGVLTLGQPKPISAASNDRYQDYVMATGAVSINPRVQTDGVWMLDYKSGKLLGTVIDKAQGKIMGWAEVDLVDEFKVKPGQDVHFMMTTGYITQSQSALYLAETATGQFGVYTMAAGPNGSGIAIKRHDMGTFRNKVEGAAPVVAPAVPLVPAVPPGPVVKPVLPMPMLPVLK